MRRRSEARKEQKITVHISESVAERYLLNALDSLGIPIKGAYSPYEVCKVIGVKRRELRRAAEKFEPGQGGFAKKEKMIDSFMLLGSAEPGGYSTANIRVPFPCLVKYIQQNPAAMQRRELSADSLEGGCS